MSKLSNLLLFVRLISLFAFLILSARAIIKAIALKDKVEALETYEAMMEEIENERVREEREREALLNDIRSDVSDAVRYLGFDQFPDSEDDLKKRYRELAKKKHPDSKEGSQELFKELTKNYDKAKRDFKAYKERIKSI